MDWFLALIIFLLCFVVLVLVFFALSSCLGDEMRAVLSGCSGATMPTTYGMQYARNIGEGGNPAGWEQIEMEDMFDERVRRGERD